jgi:ubiquinone/menaquinone biosynthesis C-methylase UbiE
VKRRASGEQDVWETLAKKDAFWTACTGGKRRGDWKLDAFLATGEQEISWAVSVAREKQIYPDRRLLAIDFGCGPGRLIGGLEERFKNVIAIDTSKTMLSLARQNHPDPSVSFFESIETVDSDSADLVYSAFVLQHLTQDRLDRYLREFARILDSNGLLIFQYPARPRWTLPGLAFLLLPTTLLNAIQRYIVHYPGNMPMSWMAPEMVARRAAASGFLILEHRAGPKYTPNWEDIWYFARRA